MARKQPQQRASEVLDSFGCGLFERDADGRFAFVNRRLAAWLGYEPEELIGRPLLSLVPPELTDVVMRETSEVDRGDARARLVVMRRKDSTTLPMILLPQPFHDSRGEFAGVRGAVVELATVQTAKPLGSGSSEDLRTTLSRIALELQSLSLAAAALPVAALPLHHPMLRDLSPREQEVLSYLVAGERVPAIAKKLFISPNTVRNHLKAIFRKLEVRSQSELIARVRSLGS